MKIKKLLINTAAPLIYQLVAVVCGFVLPRLILVYYGSEVNGLVNSITQFIAVIAYFELGMGAVVPSALYGPLARNDKDEISKIVVSANRFYRLLAKGLLIYIVVLIIVYPIITNSDFSFSFIATLIIAMSISSFAQYYFGIVDRLVLTADQKGYIYYHTQSITLVACTIVCAVIISLGFSIQIVKLATSLIYLVRPFVFRLYVNKYFDIDRSITYNREPLEQKWNGIAQHIAAIVLTGSDTIVLTVFATLKDVSIYSVYYLVINGLSSIFSALIQGFQHAMGELIAKEQYNDLRHSFSWFEWLFHTLAVLIFGCALVLIVPFVLVYTKGVVDANYNTPIFGVLITLAFFFYCLRLPYNGVILAGNHYKQTQHIFIIAAVLNITISIITVKVFGLIGVAIGTLAAMLYQTMHMAYYISKNIINWPLMNYLKQLLVDSIIMVIGCIVTWNWQGIPLTYMAWIILAIKVLFSWAIICVLLNLLFYRNHCYRLFKKLTSRMTK